MGRNSVALSHFQLNRNRWEPAPLGNETIIRSIRVSASRQDTKSSAPAAPGYRATTRNSFSFLCERTLLSLLRRLTTTMSPGAREREREKEKDRKGGGQKPKARGWKTLQGTNEGGEREREREREWLHSVWMRGITGEQVCERTSPFSQFILREVERRRSRELEEGLSRVPSSQ